RRLRAVRARQPLVDRFTGEQLEPEADRRVDAEAAAEDALRTEVLVRDQLLLHVLAEVRRLSEDAREVDILRLRNRSPRGATELRRRDDVLLQHQPEHGR